MKLAIVGGRDFNNYPLLVEIVKRHYCEFNENDTKWKDAYRPLFDEVVSGGARGADSLGARFTKEWGIKLTEFIPDWDKHGAAAGFIRNADIIQECDEVLAFWNGVSRGTQNSIGIAKRLKKRTLIIYY